MLSWGELASFGMDFWSQEAIEAALGADLADAIPELLRLADLKCASPRLEILALERLADRDGKSVDAVLARELLDVVSAHSEYGHGDTGLHRRASVAAIGRNLHAKRRSDPSFCLRFWWKVTRIDVLVVMRKVEGACTGHGACVQVD
jgi:hypothetical protein